MSQSSEEEPRPRFRFDFEDTMEHMFIKQEGTIPKLLPYRTNKFKNIKVNYQQLDQQLQRIWHCLFIRVKDKRSPEEELDLEKILEFPMRISETMPACGRVLKERETIYRCFDCGIHLSSVMCTECFEEADHRGHRYEPMQSLGGTCDCGNLSSLKPQGFCKRHCGTVKIPAIDPKERERFLKINKQLYEWFLVLHDRDDYQALALLVHQILYLDKLNTNSLYYNWLTYEWLNSRLSNGDLIAQNLFVMGPKHFDTNLAKWATELMLKLFSLVEVRQLLAEHYLKTYNTKMRFETSQFKDLFIQMFSNLNIIKKTMEKTKVSLDPKHREDDYNVMEYYNQLHYIDYLDSESAREFFRPLIFNRGVDFPNMRYINRSVDNGHYKIQEFYGEKWPHQNSYYLVIKAIAKHFQDFPKDLAQQIINQFNMTQKYEFRKNQAIIPHHRGAALFIFVYFKCDLIKIDPKVLMQILKLDQETFMIVVKGILKRYVACLREFALSLGHREYDKYEFDAYLPLYVSQANGQKVFTLDCLGLKVFGVIFNKMNKHEQLQEVLFQVYKEEQQKFEKEVYWLNNDLNSFKHRMSGEREMMRRHYKDRRRDYPERMHHEQEDQGDYFEHQYMSRHYMGMGMGGRGGQSKNQREFMNQTQQKLTRANVTYFAQLIHFIYLLFESVYIQRPEIMIGNDCKIRQNVIFQSNKNQLIQILSNTGQLSTDDMETIITFFFGDINRETILQVADFDKTRKVYTLKAGIRGIPICKDLLHSFIDNDSFIKFNKKGIAPNKINTILRDIYLSKSTLNLFLSKLVQNFKTNITQKKVTLLKYLAGVVKLVGFAYGRTSDIYTQFESQVLGLAEKQNAREQLRLVFQQSGQAIKNQLTQADKRRLQQLRRKQKQKMKLKMTSQHQNVRKILLANTPEERYNQQGRQECILCRGTAGLFYMGQYGQSSFIFNILREKGTYPYFQCCFHLIHAHCFIKVAGNKQQAPCPLCRSVCNILLPTPSALKNGELFKSFNQRLEVISAMGSKNKKTQNLTVYLARSFIQFFFIFLLQNKPISPKKLSLYKIVLTVIKMKYDRATPQEKHMIEQALLRSHSQYENGSSPFALNHFLSLINLFIYKTLKKEDIDEKTIEKYFKMSNKMAASDIQKVINLAAQLFDIKVIKKVISYEQANGHKQLSEVVKLYTPPKTINQLLKLRAQQEKNCKSGHNICVCIICGWKGCADCGLAAVHTAEDHCDHSIFFNFVSGGLIYIANGNKFATPCLYLDEKTSEPWKPEKRDQDFFLDERSYNEMLGLLQEQNVTEFVSKAINQSDIHLLI